MRAEDTGREDEQRALLARRTKADRQGWPVELAWHQPPVPRLRLGDRVACHLDDEESVAQAERPGRGRAVEPMRP
jgi:hypothetical protein